MVPVWLNCGQLLCSRRKRPLLCCQLPVLLSHQQPPTEFGTVSHHAGYWSANLPHVQKERLSLYLNQAGGFVTWWRWIIKQSSLSGGSFPSWLSHCWSELNELFLTVRGKTTAICAAPTFISRQMKPCSNRVVVKANVMTGHQWIGKNYCYKNISHTEKMWHFKGQKERFQIPDIEFLETRQLSVVTSCLWFCSTQVQIANKTKQKKCW